MSLTQGDSPDMLQSIAEVQYALNQTAAAVATLQKALTLDPKKQRIYRSIEAVAGGLPYSAYPQAQQATTPPLKGLW